MGVRAGLGCMPERIQSSHAGVRTQNVAAGSLLVRQHTACNGAYVQLDLTSFSACSCSNMQI